MMNNKLNANNDFIYFIISSATDFKFDFLFIKLFKIVVPDSISSFFIKYSAFLKSIKSAKFEEVVFFSNSKKYSSIFDLLFISFFQELDLELAMNKIHYFRK